MSLLLDFTDLRRGDLALAGGKGANLGELLRAGLPVPPGFVLTTDAYRRFLTSNELDETLLTLARRAGEGDADTETLAGQIHALFVGGELPDDIRGPLIDAYTALGAGPVAVRSSATAEDLADASFAGQQESYLNVRGPDELLNAVRECWASLWTPRAIDYRNRHRVDPDSVALAVVVQQMVPADSSGVMFTVNPETGQRDEVMIAAAWGLGESVVGGTIDADQLVVGAPDRAVRSRRIGDKAVMTVYAGRGTEEIPVPPERRRLPVLDDTAAAELTRLGLQAAAHFETPQDLEWARRGETFYLVQSRPITALPEPVGPVPTDWPLPDPSSLYFRASIVEQLPDPLSPLFADLASWAVPQSLQLLMIEVSGRELIREGDVGFPTINGYAYYRYGKQSVAKMMAAVPYLLAGLPANGADSFILRWRDQAHPRYVELVERWRDRSLTAANPDELLTGMADLLAGGAGYYTSVQTIIPLAATSEICFSRFYDGVVRRHGDPAPATFLLGFDSEPIRAEKSLYDLAGWTRDRPVLAAVLAELPTAESAAALASGSAPDGVEEGDWTAWRARFDDHLRRYGHAVFNLDFVNPVPADDPRPLLDTLRFYLRGAGGDPYARQAKSAARREDLTATVLARLDPLRGYVFRRLLRWAQRVAPAREDALADVGLAWPRLRAIARELGRRLVERGLVADADDVFWLESTEIRRGLSGSGSPEPYLATVAERRERWRGQRRANPPQMLPAGTWLDRFDAMMPAVSIEQTGAEIRGVPGSAGQVTGVARVLAGPQDFGRLQPGEILVASITTPAWTPLFALAAGVVTDIGGPLSHSSIVAREYGIPAVLGTGVATRQIPDGARIRVDGDLGRIRLLDVDDSSSLAEPSEVPARRRHPALVIGVAVAVAVTAVVLRRLSVRRRTARGRGRVLD